MGHQNFTLGVLGQGCWACITRRNLTAWPPFNSPRCASAQLGLTGVSSMASLFRTIGWKEISIHAAAVRMGIALCSNSQWSALATGLVHRRMILPSSSKTLAARPCNSSIRSLRPSAILAMPLACCARRQPVLGYHNAKPLCQIVDHRSTPNGGVPEEFRVLKQELIYNQAFVQTPGFLRFVHFQSFTYLNRNN
jgi:hypothetical protein